VFLDVVLGVPERREAERERDQECEHADRRIHERNVVRRLEATHHQYVKEVARRVLETGADSFADHPKPVGDEELRKLFTIFLDRELTDDEFLLHKEHLALEAFPRRAHWRGEQIPERAKETVVGIIGAGVSGLATALQFELLGIPYRIFERRSDLGGTWDIATFPDARVDTNSFLYQFSTEKDHRWKEYFAPAGEVKGYLKGFAAKYGIDRHVTLGAGVRAPETSWGTLINNGIDRITSAAHLTIVPGLMLLLTVLSLNVLGDGVRDALDPRAKIRLER
jgi:hypothetical protein